MTQIPSHRHRSEPAGMMRVRAPGEHSRVTTFELFFDLIFVFAITQLSHTLAGHLNGEGFLHTAILLLAVWWAWMYTTWATNWCDPDHLVVRLVLVGIMLAGLIMAASIPETFDGRAFGFVLPYVGIQVGRTAFMIWAARDQELLRVTFVRITTWFFFTGALWVAGALVHDNARIAFWVAALVVEYAGPSAGYWVPRLGRARATDWSVEGAHLAERCGLFMIIALGESLLVTGATFSDLRWTTSVVAAMLVAFASTVGMWWIYFDLTAEVATERIAHAEVPGHLARLAYTYLHLPMVAGIILSAVGDEVVLMHPGGETHAEGALAIVGGPMLFVLGYALFKWAVLGRLYLFLVTLALVFGGLFAFYGVVAPLGLSMGASATLLALAIRGRIGRRHQEFELELEPQTAG
ncbi:MAG: low temperature requirement protein A [Dehalococcoidia bacterium]